MLQPAHQLDVFQDGHFCKAIHRKEHRTPDEYALVTVRKVQPPHSTRNPPLDHAGLPGGRAQSEPETTADNSVAGLRSPVADHRLPVIGCRSPVAGRIEVPEGIEPAGRNGAVGVDEPQPFSSCACGARVELRCPTGRSGHPDEVRSLARQGGDRRIVIASRRDDDFNLSRWGD